MKSSKNVLITALLVGIVVFAVGFYYTAIKAGIPYQDPTPEMLREYNRNMKIGEGLCFWGGIVILSDIVGWIIYVLIHFLKTKKKA